MKDKLKFLTKQSLDKKIKTKWFKGVNILLLVLLIAISNIDRIVTFFGGDFEDNITIYVKDDIESFNLFETTFASLATNLGNSKMSFPYSFSYSNSFSTVNGANFPFFLTGTQPIPNSLAIITPKRNPLASGITT